MAELQPAELFIRGVPRTGTPVLSEEIRNNFQALKQSFYTEDATKPEDATTDPGQPRINAADANNVQLQFRINNSWRTALQNLQLGIPAPAKLLSTFVAPGQQVWTITHNLGSKPAVQVFDDLNRQLQAVRDFPEQQWNAARLSPASLGAAVPGPFVPIRAGMAVPFNGAIVGVLVGVDEAVAGSSFSISAAINAAPITGGIVTVPIGPPGAYIAGTPVTAGNLFVAGDLIDVIISTGAPITAGAVDVILIVQRTLNSGQYLLEHASDNQLVITHPAAQAGFAIIVG